jgi:hypothetical protein
MFSLTKKSIQNNSAFFIKLNCVGTRILEVFLNCREIRHQIRHQYCNSGAQPSPSTVPAIRDELLLYECVTNFRKNVFHNIFLVDLPWHLATLLVGTFYVVKFILCLSVPVLYVNKNKPVFCESEPVVINLKPTFKSTKSSYHISLVIFPTRYRSKRRG